MLFYVYILQSESNGRYYCGHTDNPERRKSEHNDPGYKHRRTTKVIEGPWEIVDHIPCESRGEAMVLERKIKKRGIKRYLKMESVESR